MLRGKVSEKLLKPAGKTLPTIMRNLFLIILITYLSGSAASLGQCDNSNELEGVLVNHCGQENWSLEIADSIYLVLFDSKFTTNTLLSPRKISKKELTKPKTDNVVEFQIYFENNWNDSIYNAVRTMNDSILTELTRKYIEHKDSVGWSGKTSKSTFLHSPIKHLKHSHFKSDPLFINIVRLPDFRIEECGFYINSNIDFSIYYIVQPDIRNEIEEFVIKLVKLDSYVHNALDLKNNY